MKKFAFCVLFVATFCVGIMFSSQSFTAFAATEDELKSEISDLNGKYDDLKKEQQSLQSQINNAKNEKEKQVAIKNKLDKDLDITKQQVNILEERIAALEEDIAIKESRISRMESNIEDSYELFLKRVRAMYMAGDTKPMELILGAKDYSDALMKTRVVKSVAENDKVLIDELMDKKERIEDALAEIETQKKEVASSKAEVEIKKGQLGTEISKANQEIQNIAELERQFFANKAQIEKEMSAAQAEIDAIYQKLNPDTEYVGGEFGWPLPGYSYISSTYGWRFNNTDFHTGIDITGGNVNGKNIVAANAGTVVFVKTDYVQGKSYGKYVIVDHGGGYSTLYAHCSDIVVSVGQTVSRGETIAKVGSTGWSTGPHLHFEVRIDGKHQNPWGYLK